MTEPIVGEDYVPVIGECFIRGCENTEIDQRGTVPLRDGSEHQACLAHFEAIMYVLGNQHPRNASAE